MSANKQRDKVKLIRKMSRQEKISGKSGPHEDRRERRRSTADYLREYEEELNEKENDKN